MTFADAVSFLNDGYAAKRPSWGGYVKKVVTSAAGAETETYKLVYVNRAGTSYEYVFDGSSWTAPSTMVPFDADFQSAMIADDWTTGKAADYESARTGTGVW